MFRATLEQPKKIYQITMEIEEKNRISFLDILVHKRVNGAMRVTVSKKPTHTGQYLQHKPYDLHSGVDGPFHTLSYGKRNF